MSPFCAVGRNSSSHIAAGYMLESKGPFYFLIKRTGLIPPVISSGRRATSSPWVSLSSGPAPIRHAATAFLPNVPAARHSVHNSMPRSPLPIRPPDMGQRQQPPPLPLAEECALPPHTLRSRPQGPPSPAGPETCEPFSFLFHLSFCLAYLLPFKFFTAQGLPQTACRPVGVSVWPRQSSFLSGY